MDRVLGAVRQAVVVGGFAGAGVEELSSMRERVGVVEKKAGSGLWVWMGAL